MARSAGIVVDSNAFFMMGACARRHGIPSEVWSRFPVEIDASNIVVPHVCAIERGPKTERDACTLFGSIGFALFAFRTAAHQSYLEAEVAPLVRAPVFLADTSRRLYWRFGEKETKPLACLPQDLDALTAPGTFEAPDLDGYEEVFGSEPATSPTLGARLEASPLRLWEAMYLRGYAHRYELIRGEVPLVGNLGSPLAANRSLMQCVRDAQTLCGGRAVDDCGWISVGRFRMKQTDCILEIRAALTPADIRVGFAPSHLLDGADELPTILGVLVAGGDKGKMEMVHGYTWSTVLCRDTRELTDAAAAIRTELSRWTGSNVILTSSHEWPEAKDGTFFIQIQPESKYHVLRVFIPMYRRDRLPWDAVS